MSYRRHRETGMNNTIPQTIELYLSGDIDLDTLEDRIIPLLWSARLGEERDLIAHIAVELIYIKDDLSDESIFRTRIAEIANQIPTAVAD